MNFSKIYEQLMFAHAALPYYLGKGKAFPPSRILLKLTDRCNLNCALCYQDNKSAEEENELSFEEIVHIIDQVPKYSLLTFSGGEPLLKERIHDILDYALAKHYCNMVTNGLLLSKDISRLMIDKKLLSIGISIDGIEKVHDELRGAPGTFDRVIENIRFLNEYKKKHQTRFPLIDIKMVIHSQNVHQLTEVYKLCEEINADFFTISFQKSNNIQFNGLTLYEDLNNHVFYKDYPIRDTIDANRLREELEMLDKIREKVKIKYYPRFKDVTLIKDYLINHKKKTSFDFPPCLEPWSNLVISAQGRAFPCLAYYLGDIRKQALKEIWNSHRFVDFREKLKRHKIFPACSGCCYLKIRRKNGKDRN